MKTKEIVLVGILSTLLFVTQVGLSFLPNIELVSFLIILYTLKFRKNTLYVIYVFALLEGLMYGFGIWWIMYLYVWTILWFITMVFRNHNEPLFWAILSGSFGLSFGLLCSIPYYIIGGIPTGFAYWISGIPFDILHCIGNFIIAFALYKPLMHLFQKSNILFN